MPLMPAGQPRVGGHAQQVEQAGVAVSAFHVLEHLPPRVGRIGQGLDPGDGGEHAFHVGHVPPHGLAFRMRRVDAGRMESFRLGHLQAPRNVRVGDPLEFLVVGGGGFGEQAIGATDLLPAVPVPVGMFAPPVSALPVAAEADAVDGAQRNDLAVLGDEREACRLIVDHLREPVDMLFGGNTVLGLDVEDRVVAVGFADGQELDERILIVVHAYQAPAHQIPDHARVSTADQGRGTGAGHGRDFEHLVGAQLDKQILGLGPHDFTQLVGIVAFQGLKP